MHRQQGISVAEAQKKLEHFCAYQERCHQEVVRKLNQMGLIPVAIDHIIGHLISNNYLNETRFAQSFARGKFRIKKWGKQRIVYELKGQGISSINIKIALKEISDSDYRATIVSLGTKYWESHAHVLLPSERKK